jgi:hypothetical protein
MKKPTKKKLIYVTCIIPTELHKQLKLIAENRDKSMNAVLSEIVLKHISTLKSSKKLDEKKASFFIENKRVILTAIGCALSIAINILLLLKGYGFV